MRNILAFISAQPLAIRALIYLAIVVIYAVFSGAVLALLDAMPRIYLKPRSEHHGYTA